MGGQGIYKVLGTVGTKVMSTVHRTESRGSHTHTHTHCARARGQRAGWNRGSQTCKYTHTHTHTQQDQTLCLQHVCVVGL